MGRRIGIMGGTFNPIHNGHLEIAKHARRQHKLDEIWFIPNYIPPHKEAENIDDLADERVDMLECAIEDIPWYKICRIEMERGGYSYTYETMSELHRSYPEDRFYFLLGGDSLFQFETWKKVDVIVSCCGILAAHRSVNELDRETEKIEFRKRMNYLRKKYHAEFRTITMPVYDISSTEIREKARAGISLAGLVPEAVEAYIKEKKLYA